MDMRLYMPQNNGVSFNQGGYAGPQLRLANPANDWEDELRRRMELARAQGWSDDEINRSALIERGVQYARQNQQQQQSQAPTTPTQSGAGRATGGKGLLLDLTPFGRVAEKMINPNAGEITAGEIGMEALLSLIPYGLGKVGKGAKGAKAGMSAAKGGKKGADAAQNTGVTRSLLRTSTIAPGSSLKTASEQQRLIDLARQYPQLRGSGRRKFQNVEGVIGQLSGNVDELFKGVDNQVDVADFVRSIQAVRKDIVDPNELKRFDIEVSRALQSTFGSQAPRLDGGDFLFHGSTKDTNFDAFDLSMGGKGVGTGDIYQGKNVAYMTDNPNTAKYYSRRANHYQAGRRDIEQGTNDYLQRPQTYLNDAASENVKRVQLDPSARIRDYKRPPNQRQMQKLQQKGYDGARFPDDFGNMDDMPRDLWDVSPNVAQATTTAITNPAVATLVKAGYSPTDINAIRRQVNQQMSGIYRKIDAGTTLTDKDQAFLRLKDALDGQIADLAPEGIRTTVKALNRDMNTLIKAQPEFKKLAEQRTQPLGLNLPFASGAIPQVMQATADVTARTLSNPVARPIMQQAGVRMGAEAFNLRDQFKAQDPAAAAVEDPNALPPEVAALFPNPQSQDEAIINELFAGGGLTDFDSAAQGFAQMQNMAQDGGSGAEGGLQYSSQELMNMAMQAMMAGDTASYKQLATAAEMVMEMEKQGFEMGQAQAKASGKGGPNITKVTAQQFGLAQAGNASLQQLKAMLQQNPGVLHASATPGRKLPIVGGYISNAVGTGEFDAIGYNIADTLLRLRTGATANEGEVRNLQAQIMPRAGDSQQTIARKFQQLEEAFGGVLQTAYGTQGGSFEDELMSMLTGGQQQAAYGY